MTDSPSAVRFYTPEHPNLARGLRGKLMKERINLVAQLAEGNAQDWADYNKRVGVIRGLDNAIAACDETESELNGGEK